MNRSQIIGTFIRILEHLSDRDYQQRVWIRGEGSEIDDFDETVCHFFQEADGIIEKYREFGIGEQLYQQLIHFRKEFQEFSGENDFPEEFIDTLEWKEIMGLAKELGKSFRIESFS